MLCQLHNRACMERSIYGAYVQKLGMCFIGPSGHPDSVGMYAYSLWYWSGGITVTAPFLVVFIHHVHPYRSALRGFVFIFPVRLANKEGSMYSLRRSVLEKPGQPQQPFHSA